MAKGAYIGVLKPEYEPVFANNTWAQIIKACQKNEIPSTWSVGDKKDMKINGVDYPVDIIGKNHDTYADGSGTAPLTFQLHEAYSTYSMHSSNSNAGGWTNCILRNNGLVNMLNEIPSEVKDGIKAVKKLTSAGSVSSTIVTTEDKLFLLSEVEIFGSAAYSFAGEGSQYTYYQNGGSKVKKVNGSASYWWTRSPYKSGSNAYCIVSTSGTSDASGASAAVGLSFAFCFGGTSHVNNTFGGSSVARKIKKGYLGIDNVARKIKKAYIGVGGVARPCWGGGFEYYGQITSLRDSRYDV